MPVISRGSSRLRMRLPTSVSVFVVVVAMRYAPPLSPRRFHRVDDVLIPRAPADVAFQAMPDFLLGRIRIAVQNLFRRHDHARRAESALQPVLVPERFLHGVQLAVHGQAFDGHDVRAVSLHREHRAALDGLAVDLDGAGAAQRRLASHVRPGQSNHLAQVMDQEQSRLHVVGIAFPVDIYLDIHLNPWALRTYQTWNHEKSIACVE